MSSLPNLIVPTGFADHVVLAVSEAWVHATARTPWSQLSASERVDHLPALLKHLMRVVFEPSEQVERSAMVRDAATHGEQRRTLGFDEEAVLHEYYLLRQLLWDRFREAFAALVAESLIARADAELSRATAASVRGFHREALEAQGRWPHAIEEIARE